ncbi:MAG: hypothetical protein J6Y42_00815 [Bacilli bacterium]|nr:hypothetical protein [Bacilli bacterium]
MEIIYEKTEEDEGNDCKIYKSSFIVRVTDDCFLASKCTVYRGWMGTQIDSQSSTFEDEEDAMNYIKR